MKNARKLLNNRRLHLGLLLFVGVFLCSFSLAFPQVAYAVTQSIIENISVDANWNDGSVVYQLQNDIQIEYGSELNIASGARVQGNGHTITVFGSLSITSATFSDTSIIIGSNSENQPATVVMKNSSFSSGKLFSPTGNSGYAHYEIRNNTFSNVLEYSYIWYPVDDTYITGNSFTNCGCLSIGSKHDVFIMNNEFHGHAGPEYEEAIIEDWAQYNGSKCYVQYNRFDYTGTVLKLPSGYSNTNMVADHNYWYTDREDEVASRIFDYNDDFGCSMVITFTPAIDENGEEIELVPAQKNGIIISENDQEIVIEGKITKDTRLTDTQRVYKLSGNIQIAYGCELTIGSGVCMQGNGYGITVYGALNISSATLSETSIHIGNNTESQAASVIIESSSFSSGELFSPTGCSGYAHYELRDNTFTNTLEYSYIWYPVDNTYITGNTFANCGCLSIGSRHNVYILNNTFHGHAGPDYAEAIIEDWAQYNNSNCYVQYNKFDYTGTVLKLSSGYSSANMVADHNYWYTDKEDVIDSRIFDYNDDFGSNTVILFIPAIDENGEEIELVPAQDIGIIVSENEKEIIIEGKVIKDTNLTDTQRIYRLSGNIQIEYGCVLTISSGVQVQGNEHAIITYGELNITSATLSDISILIGSNNQSQSASVIMKGSSFSDGELFSPTGNSGYAHYELRNNIFTNILKYSYIWYPVDDTYITGNTFINCGCLSIGSSHDVYILNNEFHGHSGSEYGKAIIENWAQYNNSNCYVRHNKFNYAGTTLKLPSGYSKANMVADHNYWYTNQKDVIASRIFDYNDDFGCSMVIPFLPIIDSNGKEVFDLRIPNGTQVIESEALAGITNGLFVYIPSGVDEISSDAFAGVEDLVIFGYSESAAETFANINGYEFVSLSTEER